MKKKIIVIGAGQFGRAAVSLLPDTHCQLLALSDNSEKLQGTVFRHPLYGEIPVLSVTEAVGLEPDAFLIGVIDDERSGQLTEQLRGLGFQGEILGLGSLAHMIDVRGATLLRLAERVHSLKVLGSVAELGVYRGDFAWKLNALFPDRKLFLFDTFEGFDSRDVQVETGLGLSRAGEGDFRDTGVRVVRERLPYPEQAVFVPGYFPETAAPYMEEQYAFVSLDADLYAPILEGLTYFVPRMSPGGMILLHDYNNKRFRGAKKAVEDYEAMHGPLHLVPLCDLHGSAVITL